MSERGALRARLDLLAREVAKFGVVGAVGLVVNIGVSNLLWRYTDIPTVRAGLMATFVAILCNYVGFRYWTYRDRDKSGRTRELTLFLLFSAVGAVIETGVLYAATYGFGWNSPVQSNVFKILGIGIATMFRFWSYRTWVFRALPDKDVVVSTEDVVVDTQDAVVSTDDVVVSTQDVARAARAVSVPAPAPAPAPAAVVRIEADTART
ncbi:GtrA family protein [Streptomyces sp. NBC_01022]|uniref:GtrA family protein n=1 Tax=Streptomyces sp. NBC_01022 TaxID=2903723 RepID=UPI002DDB3F94|nr:GtrA family protein [Streptomyces sp. NBC_01022]WRZ82147.1 GtrA family protein [Streptomyces sp. NBC_01022]